MLITKNSIKNWYTTYRRFVPARTFYGSLVTTLVNGGLEPSIVRSSINVSDLFPAIEGFSLPAIPLFLICKGSKEIHIDYIKFILKLLKGMTTSSKEYMYKIYEDVLSRINHCKIGSRIVEKNGIIRSLYNKPLYCIGSICKTSPLLKTVVLESVGISPRTKSSHGGLIYTYEAIAPQNKLHGFIVCKDKYYKEIASIIERKDLRLFIGRGISKGYGKAKILSVRNSFHNVNIDDYLDVVFRESNGGNMVMIALSPIFEERYIDDLSKGKWDKLNVIFYTDDHYIGWSKRYNMLKPILKVPGHGSIALFNLEHKYPDSMREYEDFLFRYVGLNFLIPLELYEQFLIGGY